MSSRFGALRCTGLGRCLILFLDPPHAVAAALGAHPLDVGIMDAAPLVSAAHALEVDLFRHSPSSDIGNQRSEAIYSDLQLLTSDL